MSITTKVSLNEALGIWWKLKFPCRAMLEMNI